MSLENNVRSVSGRLSLREQQAVSRRRLHWAVDQVPAPRDDKARSAIGKRLVRAGNFKPLPVPKTAPAQSPNRALCG